MIKRTRLQGRKIHRSYRMLHHRWLGRPQDANMVCFNIMEISSTNIAWWMRWMTCFSLSGFRRLKQEAWHTGRDLSQRRTLAGLGSAMMASRCLPRISRAWALVRLVISAPDSSLQLAGRREPTQVHVLIARPYTLGFHQKKWNMNDGSVQALISVSWPWHAPYSALIRMIVSKADFFSQVLHHTVRGGLPRGRPAVFRMCLKSPKVKPLGKPQGHSAIVCHWWGALK